MRLIKYGLLSVLLAGLAPASQAALSLDRTRIVFNEGAKAVSLSVHNQNSRDPYLAQTWIEDSAGKKITEPLMSLPPVQRIEAGGRSQVRLQMTMAADTLPQDRESLFYFYFREIPPRSHKPNTVMLAVENQLKVFYRPKSVVVDKMETVLPGIKNITVDKKLDHYELNNATPYYFTVVEARASLNAKPVAFEPRMFSPKGKGRLPDNVKFTGNDFSLIFVTDFGEQRALMFSCNNEHCVAKDIKALSVNKTGDTGHESEQ